MKKRCTVYVSVRSSTVRIQVRVPPVNTQANLIHDFLSTLSVDLLLLIQFHSFYGSEIKNKGNNKGSDIQRSRIECFHFREQNLSKQ